MDSFFKYANATQKAIRTGVSSAHKEFFQNLNTNTTKLEFVVEEQKGGKRKKSKIHKSKIHESKKKRKNQKGKGETTQGCNVCPANNLTPDEVAWGNRYIYGNNCASGWGCLKGGKKKKMKRKSKKR